MTVEKPNEDAPPKEDAPKQDEFDPAAEVEKLSASLVKQLGKEVSESQKTALDHLRRAVFYFRSN